MSEQGMPMGPGMPTGASMPMPPGGMQQPSMGQGAPPMPLPPIPQTVHDVKITRTKKYGCARVENVPPEEFGVTRRQRSVMLRDCDYCYHEVKRTEAELIAEGYDEEAVKKLPDYATDDSGESTARDTVSEGSTETDSALNKANRAIRITEHYVMMDYEGKGKAKRYRVTTGGETNTILKRDGKLCIEPDFVRFAAMTPFIMTHRFFGRSVADLVMDIQRIKTAIVRALLNNAYYANNQRLIVEEGSATKDTLDDILANKPGSIVRAKTGGAPGIVPIPNQEIGSFAFPMIEYMDSTREWRTGVTKQGQGLDPNALQNIGEKAVMDAANSARAKTKLIARIFAETGIKEMFWLLHATIRQNASEADTVKLRNQWVPVNPQEWKQRDDLTVNVGLGNGSREQELAVLEHIMTIQGEAIKTPEMKLAKPKNVYETLKQITRKAGLKTVEPYFTDPDKEPDPPKKPSPEEQKLQADVEAKKAELQFKQAEAQQKGQLEVAKMQQQAAMDQAKLEQEGALKREQMQMEIQLKRETVQAELELKQQQLVAELALKREIGLAEIASRPKTTANGGGTSKVHVGGEPG